MEYANQIKTFTDLNAWKEAHKLVLEVYKVTKTFPKEEIFGLVMQMRRAAISITSNLAEGFSRNTFKDKTQFYCMSQGSLTELQNQLIASRDISFLSENNFKFAWDQSVIAHKLITGLIKSTRNRSI